MSLLGAASGALSRPAPHRLAALLSAAAAVIAGCGGSQAAVQLPRKAGLPAVPAATPGTPASTRDQVAAAYSGYWQALGQALDARNAARAQAILAPYASAALVSSTVSSDTSLWAHNEIQYGAPVPHILTVRVSGTSAAVHDCGDFSHAGVQDAATGQVVGSLGPARVNMISSLTFSGGRWRLDSQLPVEAACQP